MSYKTIMKFSKESFAKHDLPDLLLNIYSYTHGGEITPVIKQYVKWCGQLAAERWDENYLPFDFVMKSIISGNKNFPDFVEYQIVKNILFII